MKKCMTCLLLTAVFSLTAFSEVIEGQTCFTRANIWYEKATVITP